MGYDIMARMQLERSEGWGDVSRQIPSLVFPAGWAVRVIPPFGGAMARFIVSKGGGSVSVYADFHEALGYFGGPHWEIYPGPSGENERYPIADADKLLSEIAKSLRRQNRSNRKDAA